MTEWDACGYARISALQQAMATEVLALLKLNGSERVLDVGCGNGKSPQRSLLVCQRGRSSASIRPRT